MFSAALFAPRELSSTSTRGFPLLLKATRKEAECLEKTRQFIFFHARSSASTVNNIASGVRRIRRFGKAIGLPVTPTAYVGDYEPLALGWYLVARASKAKAQSLSGGQVGHLGYLCLGRDA
jgi:hypothetical protein